MDCDKQSRERRAYAKTCARSTITPVPCRACPQVLLGCAVLVCLGGVMYESDRFKSNEFSSQKNLITVLLVIVIFFSIIYCMSQGLLSPSGCHHTFSPPHTHPPFFIVYQLFPCPTPSARVITRPPPTLHPFPSRVLLQLSPWWWQR